MFTTLLFVAIVRITITEAAVCNPAQLFTLDLNLDTFTLNEDEESVQIKCKAGYRPVGTCISCVNLKWRMTCPICKDRNRLYAETDIDPSTDLSEFFAPHDNGESTPLFICGEGQCIEWDESYCPAGNVVFMEGTCNQTCEEMEDFTCPPNEIRVSTVTAAEERMCGGALDSLEDCDSAKICVCKDGFMRDVSSMQCVEEAACEQSASLKIFDEGSVATLFSDSEDWKDAMPLIGKRHASAQLNNGTVVIAGGEFGVLTSAAAYSFDGIAIRRLGSMTQERRGASAVALDNETVLVCGGDDGFDLYFNSCETYNTETNEWQASNISIFQYFNSCETYNTETNEWQASNISLQYTRSTYQLVKKGDFIYAIGGWNGTRTSSAEKIDIQKGESTIIPPMSTVRSVHGGVALDDGVLICGGRNIGVCE